MTQLRDLGVTHEIPETNDHLLNHLKNNLGYTKLYNKSDLPFHPALGAHHARTENP
jgi:hypothetical protein